MASRAIITEKNVTDVKTRFFRVGMGSQGLVKNLSGRLITISPAHPKTILMKMRKPARNQLNHPKYTRVKNAMVTVAVNRNPAILVTKRPIDYPFSIAIMTIYKSLALMRARLSHCLLSEGNVSCTSSA